jgi:hypothetical protein
MTVVYCVLVPIIPEFLYEIRHPNESVAALTTTTSTTTVTAPTPPPPCYSNRSGNLHYPSEASTMVDTSEYLQVLNVTQEHAV